jgi:putative ubiquitin-RnfH superfamily antitoxin RatB of RatAB toxin-antitoxin module
VTEAKTRSTVSTTGTVVDVVLEETLAAWMNNVSQNSTSSKGIINRPTIVCEALGQLDDGDQVRRRGQVLADPTEGTLFMFVRLSPFWCWFGLDIGVFDDGFLLVKVGRANVAACSITLIVGDTLAELFVQPSRM